MSNDSASKLPGFLAVALALGAVGAMAFVFFEPIAAYDKLGPDDATYKEWRMEEAAWPTLAGIVLGIAAAVLGFRSKEQAHLKNLAMAAMVLGGLAAAAGFYVWTQYPLEL